MFSTLVSIYFAISELDQTINRPCVKFQIAQLSHFEYDAS